MASSLRMTGTLDPRGAWRADHCSIAATLDVVSTRSAFLIMREAFYGTTRFDDFAQRAQLSDPVTAARLRELVDAGLLEREHYREPGQRSRQRYRLTEKGADLFPALVALMQWGDRWVDDRGGPVAVHHRDCGAQVGAQLRCEAGHDVDASELDLAVNRDWRRPRHDPAMRG